MAKIVIELDTNGDGHDLDFFAAILRGLSSEKESQKTPIVSNTSDVLGVAAVIPPPTTTARRKAKNVEEKVAETTVIKIVDVDNETVAAVTPPPAAVTPPPAAVTPPPAAVTPPPAAVTPPPAAVTPPPAAQGATSFTRISNRLLRIVTPATPGYDPRINMQKLRELVNAIGIKNGVSGLINATEEQLREVEMMVESFATSLGIELPA